jgi:hypothetical protein
MKNLILLLCFLIPSGYLTATNKPVCIWGIAYGSTLEEVENEVKKYGLNYKTNNDVLICVNGKVFGMNVRVVGFHFYKDKLFNVIAAIVPETTEKIFETYVDLNKKLSEKYGKPDYFEEIYTPPFSAIDSDSSKIQALKEEKLIVISKWFLQSAYSMILTINENTEIVLSYRDEDIKKDE